MQALILAAGYATRLWPLTKNTPKPLLEVKGKPIIDHILSKIEEVSLIDKVYVVTNEKFFQNFEDWVKKTKTRLKIKVIDDMTTSNEDRKGAVGDIVFAIEEEKIEDDLLVIAGDNLFEYSVSEFVNYYYSKGSSVVACKDMNSKEQVKGKFGVVELSKDNQIVGFEEKPLEPKTTIASTACYIFTKQDLKEIKYYANSENHKDNSGDFIRWLSKHKKVYAWVFKENWFDIGSFESLGKAREEFRP
ncbi:MAG: nucleotidyltransferase family protein [Candidatus Diapherotrites archaeon]